jgi:polyphosphate kinase
MTTAEPAVKLDDPALYLNRELSWLEFNRRVLEEAQDPAVPLLERLKFLAIVTSNLDEFFAVRVAGLQDLVSADLTSAGPDGMSPKELLKSISEIVHQMVQDQYDCLNKDVLPQLKQEGIIIPPLDELPKARKKDLKQYFQTQIAPVLTPLALDRAHPFPYLGSETLNLAIVFKHDDEQHRGTGISEDSAFAILQVPAVLDRLIPISSVNYSQAYVLLEEVIGEFCDYLFPGLEVESAYGFRLTRNGDFVINDTGDGDSDDDMENLLQVIDKEVRNRQKRRAVRLEVSAGMPQGTRRMLMDRLRVKPQSVYEIQGPLNLGDLMKIYGGTERRSLRDPAFNPRISADVGVATDIFSVIRERDILLYHPYESFSSVVEFLQQAAHDPDVLAMKQTLYRTSGNSPILDALVRAAEAGKQVTALVELKARFDEQNNVRFARQLEKAGVHVVYGVLGLKTHCKASMVVRREKQGLRRYCHLGTGNYNSSTARLYTDLGYMTCDEQIGEDVAAVFNLLTGFNNLTGAHLLDRKRASETLPWQKLLIAPMTMHASIQKLIEGEIDNAKAGKPARITAKLNSLSEPITIRNLYRASQAGVQIDLIVRGICCLRPGMPGVSDNIRVISIVDRFLEHSRIYHFHAGGEDKVYVGSADWMPRNLFRRIELVYPIGNAVHKARILDTILATELADNVKAREGKPDGSYVRRVAKSGAPAVRTQERMIQIVRQTAIKSERPYEETIKAARTRKRRKR